MATFRILVDYAAGGKAVHAKLDGERAEIGVGAFTRDLIHLEGQGVKRLVVEIEEEFPEQA